jgi:hypothetical protein
MANPKDKAAAPGAPEAAATDPITGLTAVLQQLQATLDTQASQGSASSDALREAVDGLNDRLAQPVQTIPAAAVPRVASARKEKTTPCETISSRIVREGDVVTRWGFTFTAPEDGIKLVGEIPAYALTSGMEAGRYVPVGTSAAEASEVFWRAQFAAVFGAPPDAALNANTMQSMIVAKLNPAAGEEAFLRA